MLLLETRITDQRIGNPIGNRPSPVLTMVAPGFLLTPQVRGWLDGIEPAWTLLEFGSFNALRDEPSQEGSAIRLAGNISDADIAAFAVASNALKLLQIAADSGGLKLTATDNLSRQLSPR